MARENLEGWVLCSGFRVRGPGFGVGRCWFSALEVQDSDGLTADLERDDERIRRQLDGLTAVEGRMESDRTPSTVSAAAHQQHGDTIDFAGRTAHQSVDDF